jgi:predicted ribonuclease YlaK
MIELILKEYGTQLSDQQYEKINNYLERVNKQTHQNQQVVYHPTQNMKLSDRYETEEEEARRKFEQEQQRQRREFEEQQRRRKNEYQKQMKLFEDSQINPYKLLGAAGTAGNEVFSFESVFEEQEHINRKVRIRNSIF